MNGVKIASCTSDAQGDARVPFDAQAQTGKTEMDATVHVDECSDTLRRVWGGRPQPGAPAVRARLLAQGRHRRVLGQEGRGTTLVVDTGSPNATVFLRQGSVDLNAQTQFPTNGWSTEGAGIVYGWRRPEQVRAIASGFLGGDASTCTGDDSHTTYLAGGTLWLSPFLGVDGAWIKRAGAQRECNGQRLHLPQRVQPHL